MQFLITPGWFSKCNYHDIKTAMNELKDIMNLIGVEDTDSKSKDVISKAKKKMHTIKSEVVSDLRKLCIDSDKTDQSSKWYKYKLKELKKGLQELKDVDIGEDHQMFRYIQTLIEKLKDRLEEAEDAEARKKLLDQGARNLEQKIKDDKERQKSTPAPPPSPDPPSNPLWSDSDDESEPESKSSPVPAQTSFKWGLFERFVPAYPPSSPDENPKGRCPTSHPKYCPPESRHSDQFPTDNFPCIPRKANCKWSWREAEIKAPIYNMSFPLRKMCRDVSHPEATGDECLQCTK